MFLLLLSRGFDNLLELDDKGDVLGQRQRVQPGQIFSADSDLGRASCRVIGLCLSPNNYSACLYTVPSTVELSPHAIRFRKNNFSLYYNRANLRLVEDLEHNDWW
ncbi:hypothetical protein GQ457_05G023300 [Hibiscus cannabinus]